MLAPNYPGFRSWVVGLAATVASLAMMGCGAAPDSEGDYVDAGTGAHQSALTKAPADRAPNAEVTQLAGVAREPAPIVHRAGPSSSTLTLTPLTPLSACTPTSCPPCQTCAGTLTGVACFGGCVSPQRCDGSACYNPIPNGGSCATAPTHCASGHCVSGVCCGTASCPIGETCSGPVGAGSCRLLHGGVCTADAQCDTGHCVDGHCCDTPSCPQCGSCGVDTSGACKPVTGTPVGGRAACPTGAGCAAQTCTGTGDMLCHPLTNSTACGIDGCRDTATQEHAGTCNGGGACGQPADTPCSPFQCSSGACGTDCRVSGCVSPFACDTSSGKCVSGGSQGSPCSAGPCASGLTCVDGVCCASSSCPSGSSCSGPVNAGTCHLSQGTACTTDSACGTNHCTDGVCCDQACTGQCQACNLSPVGTCSGVLGAPVTSAGTTRSACSGASTDPKCAQACNGVDSTACHYPGGSTTCSANTCSSLVETHASSCDGAGNCSDKPVSCSVYGGYVCGPTACLRSCTLDTDCIAGDYCAGGVCTAKLGTGNPCTSASACGAGLFCTNGYCCGTADCGAGATCGGATPGTCQKTQGGTCAADGDCATNHCVDGICCDTSCTGQCQACNVPTKFGTCSPVLGAPHGTRLSCPASSGDPSCASSCNGIDPATCHFPGGSTSCGAATCSSGVEKHVSACDGSGNCGDVPRSCGSYVCGSTSCKITCAVDVDCITGYFCDSTKHCAKTAGIGNPCSSASACGAGTYCTDGFCCGVTSCGTGKTCGGAHPGTCSTNDGGSCKLDADCANGHCVDGVCCDSACGGQCQACDVSGKAGKCSLVVGPPHGARVRCPASSGDAACASSCNGLDATTCHYPSGSTSCGVTSCSSGVEHHVSACDGAGNCGDTPKGCDKYLCGPTACFTSCTDDSQCVSADFCSSGACIPKVGSGKACAGASDCGSGLFCTDGVCCGVTTCGTGKSCATVPGTCTTNNGGACGVDGDCGSGHCIDGVCCDTTCNGQCQACDVTGKVGTCSPTTGIPHGTRAKCSSAGTDPTCGAACDGSDTTKCNFPSASTACGAATCKDGHETHVSSCDGGGNCGDTPKACTPYACGTTACNVTCTVDTQCASSDFCESGLCIPKKGLGTVCSGPTACGAGLHCTDGYCCGDASCGTGGTCGFFGHEGTCVKTNGATCAIDGDCGSNHCVDGVCCDSKCDGQCEACDVPDSTTGRPGKCIPVKGKVHGKRVACADGGGDVCAGASCDGNDTTKCATFSGSEISCRPASCKDGVLTTPAQCNGKGACPDLVTAKCDGFVCTADGKGCESSCADDTKCIPGYVCGDGGKCKPKTATCSDDGLSSKGPDGVVQGCAPYRCGTDGTCTKKCGTSDDCAPGNSCDTTSQICSPSGAVVPAASGCGCSTPGTSRQPWLAGAAFLALAALVGSRRRRGACR